MEENIIDKFTLSDLENKYKDVYVVWLSWDSNDADYIKDYRYIPGPVLKKNPLLQYVLSYLCGGEKYGCSNWNQGAYGRHVDRDVNFDWLDDYLPDVELMLYSDWGSCHSLDELSITYFSANGIEKQVNIPDFDTLFSGKTRDEMVEFMNDLYEKYKDGEGASSWYGSI